MAANIQSLLEKVRSDRAALKPEIERLQAEDLRLQHVEDYLLKEIDAGLALHLPSIAHVNGVEPNGSTATAGRSIVLDNMMRHEACEAILKESGLPMRTVDMAERLQAKGYQKAMKPEMLSSALFTAMLRKPETFKKVGRGLWGLANKTY